MKTPGRSRTTILGATSKNIDPAVTLLFRPPNTTAVPLSASRTVSPYKYVDKENSRSGTPSSKSNKNNNKNRIISPRGPANHAGRSEASISLLRMESPKLGRTSSKPPPVSTKQDEEIISQLCKNIDTTTSEAALTPVVDVIVELVQEADIQDKTMEEETLPDNPAPESLISTQPMEEKGDLSMIGEEMEEEEESVEEEGEAETVAASLRAIEKPPPTAPISTSPALIPTTISSSPKFVDADEDDEFPLNDDPSIAYASRSFASTQANTSTRTPGNNSARDGMYSGTTGLGISRSNPGSPNPANATSAMFSGNNGLPLTAHRPPPSIGIGSGNIFRPSVGGAAIGGGGRLNFVGLPSYREREKSLGLTLTRGSVSGTGLGETSAIVGALKRKSMSANDEPNKVLRRSDTDPMEEVNQPRMNPATSASTVGVDQTAKDRMGLLKSRLQNLNASRGSTINVLASSTSAVPFGSTSNPTTTISTIPRPTVFALPQPSLSSPFKPTNHNTFPPSHLPTPKSPSVAFAPSLTRTTSVNLLVKTFESQPDSRLLLPSPSNQFSPPPKSPLRTGSPMAMRSPARNPVSTKSRTPTASPPNSIQAFANPVEEHDEDLTVEEIKKVIPVANEPEDELEGEGLYEQSGDDELAQRLLELEAAEANLPELPAIDLSFVEGEEEGRDLSMGAVTQHESDGIAIVAGAATAQASEDVEVVRVEKVRIVKVSPKKVLVPPGVHSISPYEEEEEEDDELKVPCSHSFSKDPLTIYTVR
jgi:hypothetical protein